MVAPGVAREAMLPVMERFQSADLAFIVRSCWRSWWA
jgi:hypothetical protein